MSLDGSVFFGVEPTLVVNGELITKHDWSKKRKGFITCSDKKIEQGVNEVLKDNINYWVGYEYYQEERILTFTYV